jgi:hypothetical protein
MILSIWEDMHRLYANTMSFYTKDLNIHDFDIWEGSGVNPLWMLRDNYILLDTLPNFSSGTAAVSPKEAYLHFLAIYYCKN